MWSETRSRWSSLEPLEARVAPAALLVTNLKDSGDGSLRDALAEANSDPDFDEITFKAGLKGTIKLKAELGIYTEVSIDGGGKIKLNGQGKTRHFYIASQYDSYTGTTLTPEVTLSGLTLTKGRATEGGSIYIDAGEGSVTIKKSKLTGNRAQGIVDTRDYIYEPNARGGAIANVSGALLIEDSKLSKNSARGAKDGSAMGGAIFNGAAGTLELVSSVVSGNTATGGKGSNGLPGYRGYAGSEGYSPGEQGSEGGIGSYGYGGSVGGVASGGGIHSAGETTIQKSTISGNSAVGGDGGKGGKGGNGGRGGKGAPAYSYYGDRIPPGFGGNGGQGGDGGAGGDGGIGLGGGIAAEDLLTIESSTISGNTAKSGKAGVGGAGGAGGAPGKRGPNSVPDDPYDDPYYDYSGSFSMFSSHVQHSTISGSTSGDETKNHGERGYDDYYDDPKPGKAGKRGKKGPAGISPAALGGGIYAGSTSAFTGIQVTIAKNSADWGGGLLISAEGSLLSNSTIALNKAKRGGGLYVDENVLAVQVVSSVIGLNKAPRDADVGGGGGVAATFSLIQKTGNASISGSDNIFDVNPLLGKLKKNGGTTATILPKKNSPLIDSGSNPEGLTEDPRGEEREQGAQTDIGAVETTATAVV